MYSIEEFVQSIRASKGMVCYGCGERVKRFNEIVNEFDLQDKLLFCVDRNPQKVGTQIEIAGSMIPIKDVKSLCMIQDSNIILIISNSQYKEILESLEDEGLLNGVNYYCLTHIWGLYQENISLMKKVPSCVKRTEHQMIPKLIHYCWFGGNPIPEKYKEWMKSWKKFCPDYDIIEWNESNYDITKNQYMYDAYKKKKWGFVPDYARLDIIYEHGGIYLDTDVELVKNMDDLLFQDGFAGFESDDYVALGLGFGAKKNNELIRQLRDEYEDLSFVDENGNENLLPSPVIQTDFLKQKGLVLNGEYQVINNMTIFPAKVFCGKNISSRRIQITEETKSIHHYDASWADESSREQNDRFEKEMNS